jgi:hypothetical protein
MSARLSALARASWIREVPLSCAPVMIALPRAATTASAMTLSSVATNTGPMSAATARRMTWMTMGVPPMSASGLPGSRVAAMRAGMRTIAEGIGKPWERWPG